MPHPTPHRMGSTAEHQCHVTSTTTPHGLHSGAPTRSRICHLTKWAPHRCTSTASRLINHCGASTSPSQGLHCDAPTQCRFYPPTAWDPQRNTNTMSPYNKGRAHQSLHHPAWAPQRSTNAVPHLPSHHMGSTAKHQHGLTSIIPLQCVNQPPAGAPQRRTTTLSLLPAHSVGSTAARQHVVALYNSDGLIGAC